MRFNPDTHFLILTRKGADQLRRKVNYQDADVERLRNMLVCVLSEAKIVCEYEDRRGLVTELKCESTWEFGTTFVATVIYGTDHNGRPMLSPDGKMRSTFLTEVR